jgi:hypothetical protein
MTLGMLFWVVMVVWLALLVYWGWHAAPENRSWIGGSGIIFLLLFILGWSEFGFIVSGR